MEKDIAKMLVESDAYFEEGQQIILNHYMKLAAIRKAIPEIRRDIGEVTVRLWRQTRPKPLLRSNFIPENKNQMFHDPSMEFVIRHRRCPSYGDRRKKIQDQYKDLPPYTEEEMKGKS